MFETTTVYTSCFNLRLAVLSSTLGGLYQLKKAIINNNKYMFREIKEQLC
jgi:hypothetical protein